MNTPTLKPAGEQQKLVRKIVIIGILGMLTITLGPKLFNKVREQRLLQNGVKAPAVIVDLDETGSYVNHEPEIEITLDVTPAEGEAFTGKTTKIMGPLDLKRYEVGAKVNVRFDPDSHRVALIGLAEKAD